MSTLIVPIDLQALPVGQADTDANATTQVPLADFSQLAYISGGKPYPSDSAYLSTNVLGQAVPFAGAQKLVSGIHLHWALPDGLTHGIQAGDPSQPPVFFSVPNRWLVTRLLLDSTNPDAPVLTPASWVIESDRLLTEMDTSLPQGVLQPTVPIDPATIPSDGPTMQNFRYIGQVFEASTWQESTDDSVERMVPFSAVGYGDPTFAAYYPNCNTVFGYLDTLSDVQNFNPATMTVSYQVAGWYSNDSDDPLQQMTIDPGDNPMRWYFEKSETPTNTICTGFIENIPWDPGKAFLNNNPNALTAAFGFSTQASMSALLASLRDLKQYSNAEMWLNALQLGFLSKSGTMPDALQKFDESLHAAGFAVLGAGSTWQFRSAQGQALPEMTPDLSRELDDLNRHELDWIRKQEHLVAEQRQLFADWVKYMTFTYTPPQNSPLGPLEPQDFLSKRTKIVDALIGEQNEGRNLISKKAENLSSILPAGVQLQQNNPQPRYYQPHDPVLALSGEDVVPATRYGGDGKNSANGYLYCRCDDELLTGLNLPDNFVNNSCAVTQLTNSLPLPAVPSTAPQSILEMLIQEMYLLASSMQAFIAGTVAAQGGNCNPALLDFGGTVANLQTSLKAFLSTPLGTNALYTGLAPDNPQCSKWGGQAPWLPIFLQYEVNFYPVQYVNTAENPDAVYDAQFVLTGFSWDDDDIELTYTGAAPQAENFSSYMGTVTLTPNGTAAIQGAVKNYIRNKAPDNEDLKKLLKDVENMQQLSQGLSGTVQSMLMGQQAIQLPVYDPLANPQTTANYIIPAANAIGSFNNLAPDADALYNPVRTGIIELVKLALVDVFGQTRVYDDMLTTIFTEELQNTSSVQPPTGSIFIPPRLSQPARLNFSWVPPFISEAAVPGRELPENIFGWVVTDDLQHGLFVYSASSVAIGEFLTQSGSVVWLPAPGGTVAPGTSLRDTLTQLNLLNTDLGDFLTQINSADFFPRFLSTVIDAQQLMLPANTVTDAGTAVLFGRPLALAHASVELQLQGPVAPDQSWNAYNNLLQHVSPKLSDAGFTKVSFPIRLGALSQMNDGLAGYWITQDKKTDYTQFNSSYASATKGKVIQPPFGLLNLQPNGSKLYVTMIFDPRASVHVSSGILPVLPVQVSPAEYGPALAAMHVNFLVAPVLSGSNSGNMAIPLPREVQADFSWISPTPTGWNVMPLTDDAAAQSGLNYTPQQISDGWMQISPQTEQMQDLLPSGS